MKFVLIAGVLLLGACASSGGSDGRGGGRYSSAADPEDSFMLPESDADSAAEGSAFTGAAMHFRKTMPKSKPTAEKNWDFYFKHCSTNGNETYFSKTSYDCSGPYY